MGLQSTAINRADLYKQIYSFRNLELAYRKARKGKRNKRSVREFGFNLEQNLLQLKQELETLSYKPMPLRQFVIRDPKTRLISASHFRDRVVHHALCNIIQPILEKTFIYDSHASQVDKGTSRAIERFDIFKRRLSKNGRQVNNTKHGNMVIGYVLKADIKHFFDSVDHEVLIGILRRKIKDENTLILIKKILENHKTNQKGKGMPLGNLTSQFFANVYLNELDYFVKHDLKIKYYIRYVDDFVLFGRSKEPLECLKIKLQEFLQKLKLELHQGKSKIRPLHKGICFLGFRIFYNYKLMKKGSIRKMEGKIQQMQFQYSKGEISFEDLVNSLVSFIGYTKQANTYKLRKKLLGLQNHPLFPQPF